jgi:hypothetical protein
MALCAEALVGEQLRTRLHYFEERLAVLISNFCTALRTYDVERAEAVADRDAALGAAVVHGRDQATEAGDAGAEEALARRRLVPPSVAPLITMLTFNDFFTDR